MRVHGLHCSKASASYSVRCQPQHIVAGERFHWSREERCFQREHFSRAWFILAASARARRCTPQTERNGGFGFQTKVKDRFLNQRRWTCWYSCRENMPSCQRQQFSFTFLFVFVLKSLLSLLFTSRYAMEAFLNFLILLLFDSSVFAKHSVIYSSIQHVMCPMLSLIRFC